MAKDEWVRVKSEDELRVGMTVEIRPCALCLERERFVLLSRDSDVTCCTYCATGCRGWHAAGRLCDAHRPFCLISCIPRGTLYRLADSDTIDDTEVRELEREDA